MKKFFLILLLAGSCLGSGPKYNYQDPKLNDELENVYFDIRNVRKGDVIISSGSRILSGNGSITRPSYSFLQGQDMGIYRVPSPPAIFINPSGWNTGTSNISYVSHGFEDFLSVSLTTTGSLPSGLLTNTTYYIIFVDSSTFALAVSLGNAYKGTKAPFGDQGTGVHTVTPTNFDSLGMSVHGTRMFQMTPSTLYLGSVSGITQEDQEILHIEGDLDGPSFPNSVDLTVTNRGTGGARLIVGGSYVGSYGAGLTGSQYWTGGPLAANSNDFTSQGRVGEGWTTVYRIIDSTGPAYFYNEGSAVTWSFRHGSAGTQDFAITSSGIQLPSFTLAQMQSLVTVTGTEAYCSNCTTDAVCVSTGTINSFVRLSARTIACQ